MTSSIFIILTVYITVGGLLGIHTIWLDGTVEQNKQPEWSMLYKITLIYPAKVIVCCVLGIVVLFFNLKHLKEKHNGLF